MRGNSLKFGNRLKHYRLEHNMSQQELASQLNVTSQAVSKWENNISEPDFQIIRKITELFRISYDQLFLDVEKGVYKGLVIIYLTQGRLFAPHFHILSHSLVAPKQFIHLVCLNQWRFILMPPVSDFRDRLLKLVRLFFFCFS